MDGIRGVRLRAHRVSNWSYLMSTISALANSPSARAFRGVAEGSLNGQLLTRGIRRAATGVLRKTVATVWPSGDATLVRTTLALESGRVMKQGQPPLGLSNGNISHRDPEEKPRRPRGAGGLTSYAKRMIRSACCLMQSKYGKSRLSFGTLTLPSLTHTDRIAVVKNWGDIVRVFNQRVSRHLKRHGLPGSIVTVTECQTERASTEGWPCPHLHQVFVGQLSGKWVLSWGEYRRYWAESVSRFTSRKYKWRSCENLQRVKKDAAQYLSKYFSKGSSEVKEALVNWPQDVMPRAWYSVSRKLCRAVARRVLKSESASFLLAMLVEDYAVDGVKDSWLWIRKIEVEEKERKIRLGWVGRLSERGLSEIQEGVRELAQSSLVERLNYDGLYG